MLLTPQRGHSRTLKVHNDKHRPLINGSLGNSIMRALPPPEVAMHRCTAPDVIRGMDSSFHSPPPLRSEEVCCQRSRRWMVCVNGMCCSNHWCGLQLWLWAAANLHGLLRGCTAPHGAYHARRTALRSTGLLIGLDGAAGI